VAMGLCTVSIDHPTGTMGLGLASGDNPARPTGEGLRASRLPHQDFGSADYLPADGALGAALPLAAAESLAVCSAWAFANSA
jgi:hypothetical protein